MTLHASRASRNGFALPAAIIALVLLSALVAGALFVSTEELRAGRGDVINERALALAEWAGARAIVSWDAQRNTRSPIGRSEVLSDSAFPPNDRVVVTAVRVQRRAVWLTADATTGGDGRSVPVHRTVSVSLRLVGAAVPRGAALTALGAVTVDRGVVDGRGAAAVSDSSGVCADDDTRASAAGIAAPDPARIACAACDANAGEGVFGTPAIDSSTWSVSDSSSRVADLQALAGRASITLAGTSFVSRPVVVNGACETRDALNWGDPTGSTPCADYYPVIRIRGDAELTAGSVGQGILVVEGSLRVASNARFVGVVIATGDVTVTGMGAEIVGVAFALDGGGAGASRVSDGGAVRFAGCAVQRAVLGSARLGRTPVRWWAELR